MADTLTTQSSTLATVPASTVIATDDAGASGHVQIVKLALSTNGSASPITADANGLEVQGAGVAGTPAGGVVSVQGVASGTVLPVSDGGGSLTVDGTVAVSGTVAVTDNSGSLTVDNAALSVTGGGVEASALRVTLASDSTGVLSVNDGGGALTVDGTVTVQDGGGSLTVDGTVTANAGTGTFAVSAASLPLPSGAATAAKQPALGTAGTASTDVVTVQGIASMTALVVDGSGVTQPVSGTVTANLAAGTNNIGDVDVLTVNGVAPAFGSGVRGSTVQRVTIATDDSVAVTGPLTDTQLRATAVPVSLASVPSHAVTNSGTFAVQESGGALTALQLLDDAIHTDDAAFTVASSKLAAVGMLADDTSPDSVNEGDVGIPRMTLARKALTVSTADAASLANVSASASSVTLQAANANRIGLIIHNDSTATLYVKFGATASTTSYTYAMGPGATLEVPAPVYRGVVDGIWSSATGSARMTELT